MVKHKADQFQLFYYCSECKVHWDMVWSCACDDECPGCNTAYTPRQVVNLSILTWPIWIIIHYYRFGNRAFLVRAKKLTVKRAIRYLGDGFESGREDEYVEILGPFKQEEIAPCK
jgi:hypothetical protein